MKILRILAILCIPLCIFGASVTAYSDWGWGYYFYTFGWIGPSQSEGVTAAGFSSSIEYRGYNQFSLPPWPGSGTTISTLNLRLFNNTGGSGLAIDINRVTADTPAAEDCGTTPPVYLTGHAVNPNPDQYTYIPLPAAAIADLTTAWQAGNDWFGLAYKGTGAIQFFYAWWADPAIDAALMIEYTVGIEEHAELAPQTPAHSLRVFPNPARGTVTIQVQVAPAAGLVPICIYDARGRCVRHLSAPVAGSGSGAFVTAQWDHDDDEGRTVPDGVYFIRCRDGAIMHGRTAVLVH